MTKNLHAHMSADSRDCDGGHGYDYVMEMRPEEVVEANRDVNDFHEITFRERVLMHMISTCGFGGTLETQADEEGSGWITGANWHEVTDEGYRAVRARFCEDEGCDPNATANYDQFAEAMGY